MARYELLFPIGSGGSATVFLARAPLIDGVYREVAVKLMHPKLDAGDGHYADELLDEARIVAAIRHPNVVSILEVGDAAEGVYLVMDYVQGDTLSGLIRALLAAERQLPFAVAGRVLADALLGLHTAHELCDPQGKPLGLVHRDFSPQNLLVGVDGVTRLTDFGIAKVTGRLSGTASGVVKGKVGYMSPEQALGEGLDRRSDVWAAGVVAWELLAQRRLFEGEDASVLLSIVSSDPPDVRTVRPDCPEACAHVIAQALSRDRARRFDSALVLRDALLEALRSSVGVAESDGVAMLVRELVKPQLDERERRAREIAELRGSLRESAVESAAPTPREDRRPTTARRPLLFGFAVLGLALVLLLVWRGRSEPVTAEPAASPAVGSVPSASGGSVLRFKSREPISGLVVGGKSIYVPAPATSIEVQVPPDVAFPVLVQARTLDGRSQSVQLPAGQSELELSFAATAPTAGIAKPAARPAPRPRKAPARKRQNELAPPPYE